MLIEVLPPAEIGHGVVDALEAGVTHALHGEAPPRDEAGTVCGAHEDWVRRVPKVRGPLTDAPIRIAGMVAGRDWETKASRGHRIAGCFEADGRNAMRERDKTGHGTAERVARHPYLGVGIFLANITEDVEAGVIVVIFSLQSRDDTR